MKYLGTKEICEMFGLSETTVLIIFRRIGSPAFKVGKNWRVDPEEFKQFLQKQSDIYKS